MTAANSPLCVRCGRFGRAGVTFLCGRCLEDPQARKEVDTLLKMAGRDYQSQRRLAIERYHWAGGWGRP